MATYNINRITLPNGDVCQLDSGGAYFVEIGGTVDWAGIVAAYNSGKHLVGYIEDTGGTIYLDLVAINIASQAGTSPDDLIGFSNLVRIETQNDETVETDFMMVTWDPTNGWQTFNSAIPNYSGTSPINVNNSTGIISHANSGVTAKTTQALYPFTVNATGHITGVGSAVTPVTDVQVGGTSITSSGVANIPIATTSANGIMSSSDKTKLDGITAGAEPNVQSDWAVTDTTSDAFIKNKPTIANTLVTANATSRILYITTDIVDGDVVSY